MSHLSIDSLPEPGDRYVLGEVLGIGVWAKVVVLLLTGFFFVVLIDLFNENRSIKPVILKHLENRLLSKFKHMKMI